MFPEDTAFLMHTSGTTSRPKLVPITHTMIDTNMNGLAKTYALSERDVVVHILPLYHIAGISIGLLSTITTGGTVVIVPIFDALTFPQVLSKHSVTWFTAVPTIFKAMLEQRGAFERQKVKSLRFIRSGAAATNPKDAADLEALFGVPLIDSFGMTETAGGVFSTLPKGPRGPDGAIGVPITSTLQIKVSIRDECMCLVVYHLVHTYKILVGA